MLESKDIALVTPRMRLEGAATLADLIEAGVSLAYVAEQVFLAMLKAQRAPAPAVETVPKDAHQAP